ncbi:arsinothricin resistance N-acetyltransferase ArsN1 family B [Geomesophilobacter sediminis]|uniref:N-acetyltransferase n=1 Tax=Geomesophilobacter sediminis TaxID=2798584 RepID=A0A8J7LXU7_9BACT|nr:arsinothricin resistance N-acetyltransferase ArsN1 family B [Geomesophilobacter sediminis]MBJ6723721.1 N-acetyltransferase [Geomesophilobacter sediminis]
MIRDAVPEDAAAICRIYNPYIEQTVITFETEPLSVEKMAARIESYRAHYPWLVAEENGAVVGYAYAAKWRERRAYRFAVESSVYIDQSAQGRGLGVLLYQELFVRLAAMKIHAVLACISLPNPASIALHEKLGFAKAAHFTEVGWKFDRWIDVGYWQKLLGQ